MNLKLFVIGCFMGMVPWGAVFQKKGLVVQAIGMGILIYNLINCLI